MLVTGAARRVGAEIARTLHAAGAMVAIHCRASRAEAEDLAASLNACAPAAPPYSPPTCSMSRPCRRWSMRWWRDSAGSTRW
jgi:NAD(P)-dependent dehydrogenase (short-subunit alcohol dehydrogenase family)